MRQTSYKVSQEKRTSFDFTFRNIDDVLSLNNSRLSDFVERIYISKLTVRGGSERNFTTKRDYFNVPIVNFPFICSSIPTAPVYIS